ncbi:MAG: transporter [Syntrophobacteraceae bacterium]
MGLLLAVCSLFAAVSDISAQDIEPRTYSNAPVGVNFLIVGYAHTRGGLVFDPSAPLKNPNLTTSNIVVAYARVLDFCGRSGKFDVIMPFTWLSGSADLAGQRVYRDISGLADTKFRLSVNLYGAPALTMEEFADYKQDLIIGASLQLSVPSGQYDDSRMINIGTNRWSFKPEMGLSKAVGPWTFEATAAASLYTDNDDFFGGNTRSQNPVYSMQGHVIRSLRSGIWASLDATYFTGGTTTTGGQQDDNFQENLRLGGTLALPINTRNSIKIYASSGVWARTGNNFDLVGIAWQYRWGGGL